MRQSDCLLVIAVVASGALMVYGAATGSKETCQKPSAQSVEGMFAPCVAQQAAQVEQKRVVEALSPAEHPKASVMMAYRPTLLPQR